VTAAGDTVRVWRGSLVEASFTGYQGPIEGVGADGTDVYVVTNAPVAIVVDAIGDPARRRTFRAGTQAINDVRFDRTRGQLLAASWDQLLYVWDLATGAIVRKLEGSGPLWRARTSPDGSIVIGAGGISPVVWARASGAKITQLEGHSDLVTDGEFLDDRIFVTLASNHTAIVWDIATAQPLMKFDDVDAMGVSDDRRSIALIGATGVRVWSPRAPVPDLGALPALPASPALPAR
jgi:WD40 repeat protein